VGLARGLLAAVIGSTGVACNQQHPLLNAIDSGKGGLAPLSVSNAKVKKKIRDFFFPKKTREFFRVLF
jgi:hypothetical protein